MKKIVCLLAGLLALALFAGCEIDNSSSGGGINTGEFAGVYSAASIVGSVEEAGATVTSELVAEGSSVSWTGKEYTLSVQVKSKIECNNGHSHSSNTSPVFITLIKEGSQYKYKGSPVSVTGDIASGSFAIEGEISSKQLSFLLIPEVAVKFTNLSFKKN